MSDSNLNQLFGPYLLKRVLGRGGMGTVYAAEADGEPAAVKVLSPVLATDVTFRERFESEIESLKKLDHPHIVELYGYGEKEGQLFYAMELIEGHSLQEELRQGRRFTWREVAHIAIDICGALKHAHDHGVIHRDLKPANLLYTEDEKTKLLDFGIAKLFGNTAVTTGSVMGTADYMAPEQAEGKAVDPRTDLYSMGSLMYALLTGRPPFVGKSVPEVVHKVRYESPVPVGRLAADVPQEMEQFIERLLEKNPQKRIPTALAASHRLKAMVHALSVHSADGVSPDDIDTSVAPDDERRATSQTPISSQKTVRVGDAAELAQRAEEVSVTTRDPSASVGPDRFVRVEEEEARKKLEHRKPFPWQTVFVLLGLAALVGIGIHLTRPPSADQLYATLIDVRESGDTDALEAVKSDVDRFLQHYPDDPRGEEVREIDRIIEQRRAQRRLRAQARLRSPTLQSVFEALYLEIIRTAASDPETAVAQLQALVGLYEGAPPEDERDATLLDAAREQLNQLETELRTRAETHLPIVQAQLSRAADLAEPNPTAARKIYVGIIALYGDKPWAENVVRQAQQALKSLTDVDRSDAPPAEDE